MMWPSLAVVKRVAQWRRHPVNNDGQAAQNNGNVRLRVLGSSWLLGTVSVAGLRNTTTGRVGLRPVGVRAVAELHCGRGR